MPTNMSVVLQMPRGNLETIFPRALVISGIRHLIDAKEYGRAFLHCRTQRVDMNILCDYKPEQFLAEVGVFLSQLNNVTYVDLFLSSLKYVLSPVEMDDYAHCLSGRKMSRRQPTKIPARRNTQSPTAPPSLVRLRSPRRPPPKSTPYATRS